MDAIIEIYDLCFELSNYMDLAAVRNLRLTSVSAAKSFSNILIEKKFNTLYTVGIDPYNIASYLGPKFCNELVTYEKNRIFRLYGLNYQSIEILHRIPKLLSSTRYEKYMSKELATIYRKITTDTAYKSILNYKYLQQVNISDYADNLDKLADINLIRILHKKTQYVSVQQVDIYSNEKLPKYIWNYLLIKNYSNVYDIIDKKYMNYPKYFDTSIMKNSLYTTELIRDMLMDSNMKDSISKINAVSLYQRVLDVIINTPELSTYTDILDLKYIPRNKKIVYWIYKNKSTHRSLIVLLNTNTLDTIEKLLNIPPQIMFDIHKHYIYKIRELMEVFGYVYDGQNIFTLDKLRAKAVVGTPQCNDEGLHTPYWMT